MAPKKKWHLIFFPSSFLYLSDLDPGSGNRDPGTGIREPWIRDKHLTIRIQQKF